MRSSYTLQEVRVHRDALIPLHTPPQKLTARQFLELAAPDRSAAAVQLLGSAVVRVGVYVGYMKPSPARKTFAIATADAGASIPWVLRDTPNFAERVDRIWRVVELAPPQGE